MQTRWITDGAELQELRHQGRVPRSVSSNIVLEISEMTLQEMLVIITRKPRYGKVVLEASRGYNDVYTDEVGSGVRQERLLFVGLNLLPSSDIFAQLCPEEVAGFDEFQIHEALNYNVGVGRKVLRPRFFRFSTSKKNYERVRGSLPLFVVVPRAFQHDVHQALANFSKATNRIKSSGFLTSLQEA